MAKNLNEKLISSKIQTVIKTLKQDFEIEKPKVAVLGLNPHSGDNGVIGDEEEKIMKPALKKLFDAGSLVFGPFPADGFFGASQYEKFDAVIATYHDQGLIPFKSLAIGEGINYTAGLPGVRTSPDHGVAFDIAGQGKADESSFREAIFKCVDIIIGRYEYDEQHKNPLNKLSSKVVANMVDEKISDIPE